MTHPEKVNFSVQGTGKAVVLVHGLGSSLHEWEPMIPALVGAGFRLYICDLPGHGDSPKEIGRDGYRLQAVYERLVSWIDGLYLEKPFFLGGHSLGGYLSLMFALQYPSRLRGLFLIDPLYCPEQLPGPVRLLPQILDIGQVLLHFSPEKLLLAAMKIPFIPHARLPLEVRRQEARDIKRASVQTARMVRSLGSLQPQLKQIDLPALVVWGDHDRSLKPISFPLLIAQMPNAQGCRMAGCGHHPHLEKPAEVNRVVVAFISPNWKKIHD